MPMMNTDRAEKLSKANSGLREGQWRKFIVSEGPCSGIEIQDGIRQIG